MGVVQERRRGGGGGRGYGMRCGGVQERRRGEDFGVATYVMMLAQKGNHRVTLCVGARQPW